MGFWSRMGKVAWAVSEMLRTGQGSAMASKAMDVLCSLEPFSIPGCPGNCAQTVHSFSASLTRCCTPPYTRCCRDERSFKTLVEERFSHSKRRLLFLIHILDFAWWASAFLCGILWLMSAAYGSPISVSSSEDEVEETSDWLTPWLLHRSTGELCHTYVHVVMCRHWLLEFPGSVLLMMLFANKVFIAISHPSVLSFLCSLPGAS